ncbi:hypothetical protein [Microbacterium sp. VKM Ac-2923]|uniref:hypothetical protein n=1 Tax=Microbacterium sp. VKM Ac-2923 TaxID=2929476 RepID=UPI001FB54BA6|nr:hypothetical protein [Microbacterium sp. VKM Ac-2923]MCJ1707946.1 hypothetical protein [Microbacterium sp. VKM Ac-2923]
MNALHRVTADDLDAIAPLVPRRERHRLAHHLNRRIHYAIDSPRRAPSGYRRPYSLRQWEALPEVKRVEVLTGHLVAQWLKDGHARHRED